MERALGVARGGLTAATPHLVYNGRHDLQIKCEQRVNLKHLVWTEGAFHHRHIH